MLKKLLLSGIALGVMSISFLTTSHVFANEPNASISNIEPQSLLRIHSKIVDVNYWQILNQTTGEYSARFDEIQETITYNNSYTENRTTLYADELSYKDLLTYYSVSELKEIGIVGTGEEPFTRYHYAVSYITD